MRQKLRVHRGYLRIPCCCRSVVLIGLPKVKFLVWASGGSDKNREVGKQMIDARKEGKKGVYMAPSSAPQIKAPSSAPWISAPSSVPRSAAPSLGPRRMPGWPGDCASVAPRLRLWRRDVLARRHSLRRRPPGSICTKSYKKGLYVKFFHEKG